MRITIEPTEPESSAEKYRYVTVSIAHPEDGLTIEQAMEEVITPALLAWGYQRQTIDAYLTS
jgi:hypothetical protein